MFVGERKAKQSKNTFLKEILQWNYLGDGTIQYILNSQLGFATFTIPSSVLKFVYSLKKINTGLHFLYLYWVNCWDILALFIIDVSAIKFNQGNMNEREFLIPVFSLWKPAYSFLVYLAHLKSHGSYCQNLCKLISAVENHFQAAAGLDVLGVIRVSLFHQNTEFWLHENEMISFQSNTFLSNLNPIFPRNIFLCRKRKKKSHPAFHLQPLNQGLSRWRSMTPSVKGPDLVQMPLGWDFVKDPFSAIASTLQDASFPLVPLE